MTVTNQNALLRCDWAVRVLDAWAAILPGLQGDLLNDAEPEPLPEPPSRDVCTCPKSGPSAPTYWGARVAIIVGHGPRCPWLAQHREREEAKERARRERLVRDNTPCRLWWCRASTEFFSCELRNIETGTEYRGPTPDAARLAAALAVFPTLPESVRTELGECP